MRNAFATYSEELVLDRFLVLQGTDNEGTIQPQISIAWDTHERNIQYVYSNISR
jgi:hypothetical protein